LFIYKPICFYQIISQDVIFKLLHHFLIQHSIPTGNLQVGIDISFSVAVVTFFNKNHSYSYELSVRDKACLLE
jgi:hypothetical protein